MPKYSHIYFLIALIPIAIVAYTVYQSMQANEVHSPVLISNISEKIGQLVTDKSSLIEQKADKSSIEVGQTEDSKGLGYTAQDKIAINSKGEIFTVYRAKAGGDYEIFISKTKNGKLFFEKQITDSDDTTQRVPSIAIGSDDTIHVTWYGLTKDEENGRQVKYIQSTDNGESWTTPIIPSEVDDYDGEDYWQEHPQILANNNSLYIVWEGKDSEHEEQQIKLTRSIDNGKTWSDWKNVQANPDNTQSRPYLISDNNTNLNLFMYSSRESDAQQIWHSVSTDNGENWSEWQKVSENLGDSRHASATKLSNGNLIVVWRSESSSDLSQLYYSELSGTDWSDPKLVSESSSYQFFPVIGTNKSDDIIVTWVETNEDSEFPRDDPEGAKGYYSIFDRSLNKFKEKILIDNNVYYPHVPVSNQYDNNFYIVFSTEEDDEFLIKLLTIKN